MSAAPAMNPWRVLYQLARADFLERLRRHSFLFTLALAVYFGYLAATGKLLLRLGHLRGVYNSAWVGALLALVGTVFLSLVGFYIVKNSIERDRETRVGEILAATPVSKLSYAAGKSLSNFAVLSTMVLVLALSGIPTQLLRGEDSRIDLWALLAPSLFLALPAMALVGAVAVLFEATPLLRTGVGNVVYFFLYTAGLSAPLASRSGSFDFTGIMLVARNMMAAAGVTFENGFSFTINTGRDRFAESVFHWGGMRWTPSIVFARALWMVLAAALVAGAAFLFDRFDPARARRQKSGPAESLSPQTDSALAPQRFVALAPLCVAAPPHFRLGAMFVAELRLMLKGHRWWFYVIALGLMVTSAAVPDAGARGMLLACAWLWPVLLWSSMGVREIKEQTNQLLFSAPHPLARQLPAVWLSGLAVALLTGSGFALRLAIDGNRRGLLAWTIGALFIPTLALSLGVWSRTSRLFEILYTLSWYIGPVHAIPQLDFMGSAPATWKTHYPYFYFLLTCALALAAIAGRKQQLRT